jgi:mannose-6-phosphate isomerase-like protein (cupin superfamily)
MIRGWFIGNFEPSVFNADFEVGIKEYKSGDKELTHYHKKSKEFTVVIYGKIKMNDIIFSKGDIIQIDENENANFECIDDCITVVVKTRSSFNDKFYI